MGRALGNSRRVVISRGTVRSDNYLDGDGLTQTGRDFISFLLTTLWEGINE